MTLKEFLALPPEEQAKLAGQLRDKPVKCIWILDSSEEFWETECGKAFCFIDGSPKYNEMKFCPYCGNELETDE